MSNIDELFVGAINKGIQSAEMIVEPKDKAIAFAELAKALAMKSNYSAVSELTESIQPIAEGKDAIKDTPKAVAKEEETFKEEPKEISKIKEEEIHSVSAEEQAVEQEPEVEAPEQPELKEEKEVEVVDTWTDEMLELKAEQVKQFQAYNDVYEVEAINEAIGMFSEGVLKTIDDITPMNIDAFLAFLKALENQNQEAQA